MKLPTTPLGWTLSAAGAVVALLLVIFVLGRFGVSWDPFGWAAATHEQDRVGNIQGQAGKAADDAAREATAAAADRKETRDQLTKETRDDILGQKDAGADAGDTGLAQLRGLCKRNPNDPSCARLQRANPAQP